MWRVLFLVVLLRLSECRVRLAGGSSSTEGRVEIFHNGKWGTICDDKWDLNDARVVCRSLGLPDALSATTLASFGEGSGEIWLDEVQCGGNEASLADCRHDGWGENNCGHGEDAGVVCGHPNVVNFNVSSLSGVITTPGYPHNIRRVNYQWTFRPSIPNTNVFVCFEDLDLRTYGEGSFRTTIEDSSNTELFSLENKKQKGVCVKMESAGGKVKFYASLTTPRDDKGRGFRLRYAVVNRLQAEGFCSNSWDISAKGEAGRIDLSWNPPPTQINSGYEFLVVYNSSVDDRVSLTNWTSVVIENLDPDTEYPIRVIAVPLTNEHNSALYSCSKRVRTKKERARVTNGKSASEGYVQVYHAGQWTRVCGNFWWDINDAMVACRSMGLVKAKLAMVFYGKITKKNQQILLGSTLNEVWLSSLECTGKEKNLLKCRTSAGMGWTRTCYNDAGLVCQTRRIPPPALKTRLAGGKTPFEGRVELFYGGSWSPICSDPHWDLNAAKVACKSLGLPEATIFQTHGEFRGELPGRLRSMICKGTEASLLDCKSSSYLGWGYTSYCFKGVAGVVCGRPTVEHFSVTNSSGAITTPGFGSYMPIMHRVYHFPRPAGSSPKLIMYLEKLFMQRQGRGNSYLTIEDGTKNIVYQVNNTNVQQKLIELSSWPVKMTISSSFTISSIIDKFGVSLRYLVVNEACENWNMTLTAKPEMIRVNMMSLGEHSVYEYAIVYKSKAMAETKALKVSEYTSNHIYALEPDTLYTVSAFGFPKEVTHNKHYRFCSKNVRTERAKLRLTGGKFPNEGLLEMLYGDTWSTICGTGWDINDATVACRDLGLPPATFALRDVIFGYIKPRSKMNRLECKGSENKLTECRHDGWKFWLENSGCNSAPAVVVCGRPKVTLFNITTLTDMLLSPGFPKSLDQADYEWTFRPPMSNAQVLLCIEQLDIYRGSNFPGLVNVSVVDADGKQLYSMANGGSISSRIHVLIENNPSKLVFQSPYTFNFLSGNKGFRMRYFVFDESCNGNWNISVKSYSGSIDLSWSLAEPKSSKFKYAVVYYPSAQNIQSQATKSTLLKLDSLELNTEYIIRLFAFVPGTKNLYYCTKRVRTNQDSSSSEWSISVKPGIGKLDVSWEPLSNDSDYKYRIQFNTTRYRNKTIYAHTPGASIDYLPPDTTYRVTVLALHKINDTVTKRCTRYVRTKAETFRIAGGRIPNEGRVEIYSSRRWRVVCGYDWNMDNGRVACRVAGFPAPTAVFGVGGNPFATKKKLPFVINQAVQCKGYEMSLLDCPTKRTRYICKSSRPAAVVCGKPKECKTVLKEKQGTIRSERYFSTRKMDCQWNITAPSNTTLIVLTLRSIKFPVMAFCRESSLSYIDSHGRVLLQLCRASKSVLVMVGFAKIRLFMNRFFNPMNMKLDYFVSDYKLQDIVEAQNWNITVRSRSAGRLTVKWPYYKPTDEEKFQNLNQVVMYVPVCVQTKNGRIITTYHSKFSRNPESFFKDLEYGEYTVFVLAYLGNSQNTPLTNWKKAARKSRSFTLKSKPGRPLRAPTNVTATPTGTNSILVTWDPIPEKYANGIISGYTVFKDYDSPYRGKVVDTMGSSVYGRNFYKLTQAFSNKKYTFRVKGFTRGGSGPTSPKVSATTGYDVSVYTKYGYFDNSNGALYPSNTHKTWVLRPWISERYDEILIVFMTFDLESSHACSNDYVKVMDNLNKEIGGKFCGKKSAFAVSVMDKKGAGVAFHSNAAIEKRGFSAFFKAINNKRLIRQSTVWNLRVQSASFTGAVLLWNIPAGNVSNFMVLFKESSVHHIWHVVKVSPRDGRIILKDLLPAKQYHVQLVGTIFDIIQESQQKTFTTMGRPKPDAGPK